MWHLYFWIYYITSIWNKWKCERENQSLDSYLPEDYYDLNYNGRTKLSIFLIRYIGRPIGSYLSDDPQEKKNLKLSLWAKPDVNCEHWQTVLQNSVCN